MPATMTEMQKSALSEAGNIGSGHAAIALSQLMGRKIMIAVPLVQILDVESLESIFSNRNNIISLVSLKVFGDVKGIILFSLEHSMALSLCEIVMGQPRNSVKELDELGISALKEVASIVTSSYLNALSEMTSLSLIVSTPDYHICEARLIEDVLRKKDVDRKTLKDFLCIKTEFIEADARIEGYFLFIPMEDSVQKLLGSLGV